MRTCIGGQKRKVKIIVTAGCEVLIRAAPADEPPAPVDHLAVVDGLFRVQQVVQQGVQVRRRPLGRLVLGAVALGLHEGGGASLALADQELRVRHYY